MHLHLATTNPGKLRDFAHAVSEGPGQAFTLEPLPNLFAIPAPEETALTFQGNAELKALYYSTQSPDLYVLADDSGLEVDLLAGAPGVRSARYADDLAFPLEASQDERNNAALLAQLARRTSPARYRCVLALAHRGKILLTTEGTVEGLILTTPRGTAGFGYDPLFLLPALGLTMAEISPEVRQQHSHRAKALAELLQIFQAAVARKRRNGALLAAIPATLLAVFCLPLLVIVLLLTAETNHAAAQGMNIPRPDGLLFSAVLALTIALCTWAAFRSRHSRPALVACAFFASLFLLAGGVELYHKATEPNAFPFTRILLCLTTPLPLLGPGVLGLSGAFRALTKSTPSNLSRADFAQTQR